MGKFKKAITFLISSMMAFSMIGCTGGTTTTGDETKTENTASTSKEATQEAETTSDEVVTLNLWHIWAAESESSKAPFEAAVKEFNAENPNIQVVLDATENETYKTKMTATIAANEAPETFISTGAAVI